MLVNRGGQVGRNQRGELGLLGPGFHSADTNDTGQLDLHLNRAVQIQIPEEAILIIPDRKERADHQTSRASDFRGCGQQVPMLPQHAVIFFVHADGVFDGIDGTVGQQRGHIKIMDFAQTVAAQGERIGQIAHTRLAGIKHMLPGVHGVAVAIGNHHVRQRGPIQNGPPLPGIVITQRV